MHYIYWLVEQEMKFDWKIIVGSIVGFLGAALGSVGGVGGGGIFVPMLALIIGFDPKSSTAISKCKCVCILCFFIGRNLNSILQNLQHSHTLTLHTN